MVVSVASIKLLLLDNAEGTEDNNYTLSKWGERSDNVAAAGATGGGFADVEMEEVKPESSREEVGKMVEDEDEDEDEGEEVFCSKIDSKGWQCHKIAKSGYTLCEHHLSRQNRYNQENGGRESDNNKAIEQRRRGRPKKASASTDSNGYYYYSGFGPRWGGKRRGGRSTSGHDNYNGSNEESSINVSNFESPDNGGEETVGTTSRIGYGELDYMVEEEEDGGSGGGSVKKRARKPIKARSLKSLM